jgi:hypothetical protein
VAQIFVNPDLPDYFLKAPEITCAGDARSFIPEYEAGKIVVFPSFKADIDHEFWSALPTHRLPELKKYSALVDPTDHCDAGGHFRNLIKHGVDEEFARVLSEQFAKVYSALFPLYYAVFSGYEFDRRKVVWRLNTILNENMHVDTYKEENEQHFARMFVNLDNQPRIWQTSWPIELIMGRLKGKIAAEHLAGKSRGEIWATINRSTFGKSSREWWDSEPRHVVYFDPGDVWIVDSRQVSHQIFYGRRALSIDFTVPKTAMRDPDRHYLGLAGRFRKRVTRGGLV